jgi:hypothetical protein
MTRRITSSPECRPRWCGVGFVTPEYAAAQREAFIRRMVAFYRGLEQGVIRIALHRAVKVSPAGARLPF